MAFAEGHAIFYTRPALGRLSAEASAYDLALLIVNQAHRGKDAFGVGPNGEIGAEGKLL